MLLPSAVPSEALVIPLLSGECTLLIMFISGIAGNSQLSDLQFLFAMQALLNGCLHLLHSWRYFQVSLLSPRCVLGWRCGEESGGDGLPDPWIRTYTFAQGLLRRHCGIRVTSKSTKSFFESYLLFNFVSSLLFYVFQR